MNVSLQQAIEIHARSMGSRFGAKSGRWRARQKAMGNVPAPSLPPITTPVETTAEAIATLDAKFPWLRNAESRCELHP